MFTVGSLFSGIGGIDYAFAAAGFEVVYQVEIDPFCRQVLAKHFPQAQRYGDIFNVRSEDLPAVDVLCAGFPCQPFSLAGNQRGTSDERFLWPELLRVIRDTQPAVVFLENVSGLRVNDNGETFKRILRELAEIGYLCQWHHLYTGWTAGSPHRRERVFIVGYASGKQREGNRRIWERVTSTRFRTRSLNGASSYTGILSPQPRMGCSPDGLSARLVRHQFPAARNQAQYAHEPPRVIAKEARRKTHKDEIKAYGNAVVPQAVYPVALAIKAWLEGVSDVSTANV